MRSRKKRMEDIRTAKDQKMKKVAIALGVVFVAVLAFEVPAPADGYTKKREPLPESYITP